MHCRASVGGSAETEGSGRARRQIVSFVWVHVGSALWSVRPTTFEHAEMRVWVYRLFVAVAPFPIGDRCESVFFVEGPAAREQLGCCEPTLTGVSAEVLDGPGLELWRQGRGAADGRSHASTVAFVCRSDSPCHRLATHPGREGTRSVQRMASADARCQIESCVIL